MQLFGKAGNILTSSLAKLEVPLTFQVETLAGGFPCKYRLGHLQGDFWSFISITGYTSARHDIFIPLICVKYQCHPLALLQIAVIRNARLTLGRVILIEFLLLLKAK